MKERPAHDPPPRACGRILSDEPELHHRTPLLRVYGVPAHARLGARIERIVIIASVPRRIRDTCRRSVASARFLIMFVIGSPALGSAQRLVVGQSCCLHVAGRELRQRVVESCRRSSPRTELRDSRADECRDRALLVCARRREMPAERDAPGLAPVRGRSGAERLELKKGGEVPSTSGLARSRTGGGCACRPGSARARRPRDRDRARHSRDEGRVRGGGHVSSANADHSSRAPKIRPIGALSGHRNGR